MLVEIFILELVSEVIVFVSDLSQNMNNLRAPLKPNLNSRNHKYYERIVDIEMFNQLHSEFNVFSRIMLN
jgi:hypothetical protein